MPITTDPTINQRGDEEHPSFGVVRLTRVTAQPGRRLFDSSLPHNQYVNMQVARATRTRSLHHDWIHGSLDTLLDINLSLTQWGAMVSSFGVGGGTPVTLHRVAGELMPEAAHESRLAQTSREVADSARKSTDKIREAAQAVTDAFESKAGRRVMADVISNLQHAVDGVPNNMKFAADTLTRHAEDVVSKAKADIEAARQFGALPAIAPEATLVLELDGGAL
jgi:hypothetical protein